MAYEESRSQPKAAVIYTSRFGTTEKIARALEAGLRRGGLQAVCANVNDVTPESLKRFDLLCFGGPTEFMGLSKRMDEFLEEVRKVQLSGKRYFAFDTRSSKPFTGSAAKCIQNRMDKQGLSRIAKRESAIVRSVRQGTLIIGNILGEGEAARFEKLGMEIGKATITALTARLAVTG